MEPLSISWSSLQAHEFCKQQGMLFRTGHKNPSKDVRSYFHGTVADRIMRTWLMEPEQTPGKMVTMVDDFIVSCEQEALESGDGVVRWKSRTDRSELREFCIELVRRLEPILRRLVLAYDYEPAKRFTVPVQIPYLTGEPTCIHLKGEMDLLTRNAHGHWGIWDLKATRNENYWRKTMAQLVFYDLALYAMFDDYAHMTGLIQPMCTEQVLGFTITDDDRAQMWSRICRFASDIWQRDFEPKKNTTGCTYCPVYHACIKFKPVKGKLPTSLVGTGDLL